MSLMQREGNGLSSKGPDLGKASRAGPVTVTGFSQDTRLPGKTTVTREI